MPGQNDPGKVKNQVKIPLPTNMMRRMTSRHERGGSGYLSSMMDTLSNNKWLIVGCAVVACGAVYALGPDGKKHRHHHRHKKKGLSLRPGQTMIDAKNLSDSKSLRVGSAKTENMVRVFRDKMDKDHNGSVDQGEFVMHCKTLNINSSVASHLFIAIDKDQNDELDLNEIFDYVSTLESGNHEEKLDCIFSFLAGNKDALSRSECKKVLASLVSTAEEAGQVMKSIFEAGGSARQSAISRDDFVSNIANSDSKVGKRVIFLASMIVDQITSQ